MSPGKIYSAVKDGARAKLHIKSGCEVEKGTGEKDYPVSELLEEEEEEKRRVGG